MKHLKQLFTVLLLLCTTVAFAEEVTINGIRYDVITKAKQAKVIAKETGNYRGNIIIPDSIVHNGITHSVTSIGDYAFSYCWELTSIEIPGSVTSIGEGAFENCNGPTSVHISDLTAWCGIDFGNDCANPLCYAKNLYLNGELVTELVIPNDVTKIKSYAFSGCYGLTSITIPNSVTSIGNYAFSSCYGLTSIEIPNSVTSIGEYAFYGCTGLISATIGNSVTRIYSYTFSGCTGLTSVVIPNSVTSINSYAFTNCSGLTSIVIPNSVTSIGDNAFTNCSGLTSITIGSGIKSIGYEAFAKCSELTEVYCYATTPPPGFGEGGSFDLDVFKESYPEYMTLYVPATAINDYKTTSPWSSFGNIVALNGTPIITPKCANPVISYNNGEISFDCTTANAEFITKVTSSDINTYYNNKINLSATYNICVYATATGYDNSDTVNATLCWIECNCNSGNGGTNIINIPTTAMLVTSSNGVLSISCQLDGEEVAVYTTAGTLIATTAIENGTATVATGLSSGSVAIVKIAGKSIKVAVN